MIYSLPSVEGAPFHTTVDASPGFNFSSPANYADIINIHNIQMDYDKCPFPVLKYIEHFLVSDMNYISTETFYLKIKTKTIYKGHGMTFCQIAFSYTACM